VSLRDALLRAGLVDPNRARELEVEERQRLRHEEAEALKETEDHVHEIHPPPQPGLRDL